MYHKYTYTQKTDQKESQNTLFNVTSTANCNTYIVHLVNVNESIFVMILKNAREYKKQGFSGYQMLWHNWIEIV